MRFHITDASIASAAAGLAQFGIETGGDGIPTALVPAGEFSVRLEGGVLTVRYQKRVQIFLALKLAADSLGAGGTAEFSASPAFRNLTYMLDCSRNAVATCETVEELIRHLAVMGYDSLGLYMEDTFTVPGYPYFGYLRDAYTKEDIARMEKVASAYGIELVPYIQTLAHFNTLTRHYAMDGLFDTGDILMTGEERTYEFLDALLKTVSEYFTTRSVHLGMDEAYMLGRGKYLDKNGNKPRIEIMQAHLERVLSICKKYGLQPMMWSDMFFSQVMEAQYGAEISEEIASRVPSGVELIYWDYYHTSEEHYTEMIAKHRVFRNPLGFAAGAWKWLGYTPDNRYSFASNEASARACIKAGIPRYIVTGWGDNGGECSPFATLPALLHCARMNYGDFSLGEDFGRSFQSLAGMPLADFMTIDLCNRVTESEDAEEKNSANKFLLFNDVLLGTLDTTVYEGLGDLYFRHAYALQRAKKSAGRFSYLFETQLCLARVLASKADMGIRLRKAYAARDTAALQKLLDELKQLPARIEKLYRAMRAQWEHENRPNGFDVQDIRFGALKQRIFAAIAKLSAFLEGTAPAVPELEAKLLDFMGHGDDFELDPDQCEWRWRRMTSVNVNE